MDKNWGLSHVAHSSFYCFKSSISGEKRTKTETSRDEWKKNIKLKRTETSVFT